MVQSNKKAGLPLELYELLTHGEHRLGQLCCRPTCSNCSNTLCSSPGVLCFVLSALGITAGSHRLWSHRSYKATLPLRIFLTIVNSMAFQVSTSSVCRWSSEGSAPLNPCLRDRAQADGEVPLSYCLLLGNNQPLPSNTVMLESFFLSSPCLIRG